MEELRTEIQENSSKKGQCSRGCGKRISRHEDSTNGTFLFYAESKKEVGILNPTFTMLFKYKGQLLVGAVTNDVVLIFTGHFFDRYKERFFKIHKDSRPVTNREIMKVFFLFNSNYCFYSKEKEENVRGYCYDGMLLGDWIGEEGGFVKTFISRQEMKMNQFVEYFEFFLRCGL